MKEKEFLPKVDSALGISVLNPMQQRMMELATEGKDIMLLAPTGSGKTLAFILPLLKMMRPSTGRVQALIIAPTRELVLQITGIVRKVAPSLRTVELYGGHKVEDEVNSLRNIPDIVTGTPGRMLDHVKRGNIDLWPVRICVLDEFDKTLELGFEKEVSRIFASLKNVSRVILTSATAAPSVPDFVPLREPVTLDYLEENKELRGRMVLSAVRCPGRDKLQSLLSLLQHIYSNQPQEGKTIIFVNHRESADRVYKYLSNKGVSASLYHGALTQTDRTKAIALLRSGSRNVLVSTDLASRGLDIPGVENVIHYHLPLTPEAFTHRNGRTARADATGHVWVMLSPEESLPEGVNADDEMRVEEQPQTAEYAFTHSKLSTGLETLSIAAGKREKLSKGDILGWLVKDMGVQPTDVGAIEISDHSALVALPAGDAYRITQAARSHKIKGRKYPVHLA